MKHFLLAFLVIMMPLAAHAQHGFATRMQNATVSQPRKARPTLNESQKLVFKAQQSLIKGDYAGAEALYTQAIAQDNSNIQAYLHRGVVRREQRNSRGVDADARAALSLANDSIRVSPRDPDGYYNRSLALRLLYQFDQAKKDVLAAIQLGGKASLRNDLQAIELERRIAASMAQNNVR